MATYDYKCQSCGHEMTVTKGMTEPDPTECPSCEDHSLKQVISASGFTLKGFGWYESDFKHGDGATVKKLKD